MNIKSFSEYGTLSLMSDNFVPWLITELEDRDWSQRELARRADLSQTTVSLVIAQERLPSPEFCIAVAYALRIPPEDVLRRAGHLPAVPDNDALDRQAVFLIHRTMEIMPHLPAETQRRIAETAHLLAEAHAAAAAITQDERAPRSRDKTGSP